MDEVRSHVRLDLPSARRQGRPIDCSTSFSIPMMEGPCADSEEKHEPVSDTNTAASESLKALDPLRPIREADIGQHCADRKTASRRRSSAQERFFLFGQLFR